MSLNFNCPVCNSSHTQRVSVVYRSGISRYRNGISQTEKSSYVSPPNKQEYLGPLFGFFIIWVIVNLFIGKGEFINYFIYYCWLAISVLWVLYAVYYNFKEWPKLMQTWNNCFICNRCEHIFHS